MANTYARLTLQTASQFCITMASRGEIVERIIRESGFTISRIAAKLKISRTQLYDDFSNPEMPLDRIVAIGKLLHHDFSQELKDVPAGIFQLESSLPAASAALLQDCQSKLLSAQEQLIAAMNTIARYKEKYGPEPA